MKEFTYVITEEEGIHARPAGILVKEVKKYESSVTLLKGEKKADLKKLLAVMSLGVKKDEEVTIRVEGSDEDIAVEEIKQFFTQYL